MILLEKEYSEYIIRIAHKTLIGAVDVRDHYELRIWQRVILKWVLKK